jgi:hypothetical protein
MLIRTPLIIAGLLVIVGLAHSPPVGAKRIAERSLQDGTAIDSAVLWPGGKVYFVRGNTYWQYDVVADRVDPGFPRPVAGLWPGLEMPFQSAVAWPNGKAYFFRQHQYSRFDIATNRTDPGSPFPTFPNWRGIQEGPNRSREVNAVLIWPNGKAYFFQDDRYYSFDIKADQVDVGYPKLIKDGWRGLAASGQPFVAAFVWPQLVEGRQKAYFFHHSIYYRYDVLGGAVDPGYPKSISGNWPGL